MPLGVTSPHSSLYRAGAYTLSILPSATTYISLTFSLIIATTPGVVSPRWDDLSVFSPPHHGVASRAASGPEGLQETDELKR